MALEHALMNFTLLPVHSLRTGGVSKPQHELAASGFLCILWILSCHSRTDICFFYLTLPLYIFLYTDHFRSAEMASSNWRAFPCEACEPSPQTVSQLVQTTHACGSRNTNTHVFDTSDMLVHACSGPNIPPQPLHRQVLLEFKEYATEIDVEFVRKAVRAIGRCAISLERAAESCINVLLELIQTKVRAGVAARACVRD